jgi:photosystem I subunit 12
VEPSISVKEFEIMADSQVFVALVIALIPGILAFRLATELYK